MERGENAAPPDGVEIPPSGGAEQPDGSSQESRRGQLLRRSTTVSLFIGLGVVAGFLVDVLVVARYGLGTETDAFFGAYTIPFILVTRMAALQPVLVTVLGGYRDDKTAFSILLNAAGLITIAVAVLGALLARPLVTLTTPGFAPATADLAVHLARILFARVPAAAVAEVCKAELYSQRRFGLATFSNALPSLVTVALLLIVGGERGIEVVAYGFVVGTVAQAALLAGLLFGPLHVPYRWPASTTLRHAAPILQQTGRMVLAPLAGLFLRQGVTLAERFLGSFLPPGSVTALSYANRLNAIVAGVFFDGITTASLPSLADRWRQGANKAARAELESLLKLATYVAVPVGLAVAALSAPLVSLFFERGQVDSESALLLGTVLGVYSLSLPPLGPFRAIQTFFYAIKEMRPVVFLLGGLAALTVGLDLILVWSLGALGLALAYALSCGMMTAVGLVWLERRVRGMAGPAGKGLDWRRLGDSAWRLILTSVAMAGTLLATSRWLETITADFGRLGLILTLGLSSAAGLAVFVGLGTLLRLDAVSILWSMARNKWRTIK